MARAVYVCSLEAVAILVDLLRLVCFGFRLYAIGRDMLDGSVLLGWKVGRTLI
jgi:hypothetical protein